MVIMPSPSPSPSLSDDVKQVIEVFQRLFFAPYDTELIAGADEPIYLPATNHGDQINRLYFREDFLSSALHETAHWCIAGVDRRRLEDFGYWYNPDGRTPDQQQIFEVAEIKPQALEWMFSVACRQPFRLSVDNLSAGQARASEGFAQAVSRQAVQWCVPGALPDRAELFIRGLMDAFDNNGVIDPQHYQLYRLI